MKRPFFKKSHKSWFVEIDRKQINLGKDREEAFKRYHSMMAGETPIAGRSTVIVLLDQFLCWVKENRAPRTYDWYYDHIKPFSKYIGRRTVGELKPIHVTRWLATLPGGTTWKNGAARAVSRAFNWARKQGLIQFNPVEGLEKPTAEHRECYITEDQWATALKLLSETDPARDIMCFLRETGARPVEARIASASHWDRANKRLVFETKNSKGKRYRRVIRLNQAAQDIVARLALKNPDGPLFNNRRGRPWTASALDHFCASLSKKLDFEFYPYVLRHSWITDALLRGVDPMTVSILAGHRDATMVMRVYGHLAQQDSFLEAKLRQATGEDVA